MSSSPGRRVSEFSAHPGQSLLQSFAPTRPGLVLQIGCRFVELYHIVLLGLLEGLYTSSVPLD